MISEPKNRIERERHMQFAGAMRGARRPSVGTKTLSSSDALGDGAIEERSFVATLLRMTGRAVWMLSSERWASHRQTTAGGRGADDFADTERPVAGSRVAMITFQV